jgi:hypothetical protein
VKWRRPIKGTICRKLLLSAEKYARTAKKEFEKCLTMGRDRK